MAFSPSWGSGRPQPYPLLFFSVKQKSLGIVVERDREEGTRERATLYQESRLCIHFWSFPCNSAKRTSNTFGPSKALYYQQGHHYLHNLF